MDALSTGAKSPQTRETSFDTVISISNFVDIQILADRQHIFSVQTTGSGEHVKSNYE